LPETIDDAPRRGRSAAEDDAAATFLAREEWAERPGEESRRGGIAAQAIEVLPVSG